MFLMLLLLLLLCVGARKKKVFFVKKGMKVTKKTTPQKFSSFCSSVQQPFWVHHTKNHIKINQIKMADTSMDYSEYSENENSSMPVAKVRESVSIERWTPPPKSWWWWYVFVVCVSRSWWDMKFWKISFFPPKYNRKIFHLFWTPRAHFLSYHRNIVLYSSPFVMSSWFFTLSMFSSSFSMHHLTTSQRAHVLFTHI